MSRPTGSPTATAWLADTLLVALRRVREFNAAQVELHERWLVRHGTARRAVASRG